MVVEDQEYTLDGAIMTFEVTPLRIDPNPNIDMSYSAALASGEALPGNLISFNSRSLEFTIRSDI